MWSEEEERESRESERRKLCVLCMLICFLFQGCCVLEYSQRSQFSKQEQSGLFCRSLSHGVRQMSSRLRLVWWPVTQRHRLCLHPELVELITISASSSKNLHFNHILFQTCMAFILLKEISQIVWAHGEQKGQKKHHKSSSKVWIMNILTVLL